MSAPSATSPASGASHLRQLLEPQPVCLLRVRLDGVVVACNSAALALLCPGESAIGATNLVDRIAPAGAGQWQQFVARCCETGAASFACDLVIRDNEVRAVLVDGAVLTDHADGVESLLVQLGDPLQPQRPGQSILGAVVQFLDQRQHAVQDPKSVELERKLEESRLAAQQNEREYHRDVAMLKAALAGAHAARTTALGEKQQLATDAAAHQQALADLQASSAAALADLRSQLAQMAGDQRGLAARVDDAERQRDRLIADQQRMLAEIETGNREAAGLRAEDLRLKAVVGDYDIERQRTAASHQAAVGALEQSLAHACAEQTRMAARAEEQAREQDLVRAAHQQALIDLHAGTDAALADLQSQLARTAADQNSLAERAESAERELEALRGEHARAHERLVADHQQALAVAETDKREALEQLRSQQSQAVADQHRLVAHDEEHERERNLLTAEHQRALADVERGKVEALADLQSQLSEAFADQRRLAARADEQQLELDRLRAEHDAALADLETRNRDLLADIRSGLARTAAEHHRVLAERAADHARERDRINAENSVAVAQLQATHEAAAAELRAQLSAAEADHARERDRINAENGLAVAQLQATHEAAASELRAQLSAAVSEHQRLTALLEDTDRDRERMAAEHARTIAELQASKQQIATECERVLMEVQQALKASRRLEVERRLSDGLDGGQAAKADRERVASLQRSLTVAFSRVQAVFTDETAKAAVDADPDAPQQPDIATIEPSAATGDEGVAAADLPHEPFDDADDAFVHQLLGDDSAASRPEALRKSDTVALAQAGPGTPALPAVANPADAVFDAQDAAFACGLMEAQSTAPESVNQADADPPQECPPPQPATAEES